MKQLEGRINNQFLGVKKSTPKILYSAAGRLISLFAGVGTKLKNHSNSSKGLLKFFYLKPFQVQLLIHKKMQTEHTLQLGLKTYTKYL